MADLCVPSAVNGGIAVVLVHGGGSVQGDRRSLRAWEDFLGSNGIVTLNIDYVLVAPTTPSPVFPTVERNVKAAVQYLRGNAVRLGVRIDRIALLGTSAGARLGGVVHTTPDDPLFKQADEWGSTSDHIDAFIGLYGGYNARLATGVTGLTMQQYYGGDETSTDPIVVERIGRSDATARASAAHGPALLFHGARDDVAPIIQSRRFCDALVAVGKDCTLVVVPDAGHSFDRERTAGRSFTAAGQGAADQALAWLRARFAD